MRLLAGISLLSVAIFVGSCSYLAVSTISHLSDSIVLTDGER